MKKPAPKEKKAKARVWNLGLLYKSLEDPQIEKDMASIESAYAQFGKKYQDGTYLKDTTLLKAALEEYEKLAAETECKPLLYFYLLKDIQSSNTKAIQSLQLFSSRIAKAVNNIIFFEIGLGKLPMDKQKEILNDKNLSHFKVFLGRIFDDAQHTLTVAEEKIINLKSQPAAQMWSESQEKALFKRTVKWKGKTLPLSEALDKIHHLTNSKERYALDKLVSEQLKNAAEFAEAEMNAIYTNKKIDDELRGYEQPFDDTVLRQYRNDPKVVENLIKTVTDAFPLSHRFYKLKAKMLKLKKLRYADRKIGIGTIKTKFTFEKSVNTYKQILSTVDPKYPKIMDEYVKNGQIDVYPHVGKMSGAYCLSPMKKPTFVLLNHTDTFYSLSVLAHEMGHAFHGELSRSQTPLYYSHSYSLAETASTLFETLTSDAVTETLPENEKIIALHDRVVNNISGIFRQAACFNFELDLHKLIRTSGFASKEQIADLHNRNMKAYLGPVFYLEQNDGYMFVAWSHLRRFFYVYSYVYGQLVTLALLRRYRADKSYWKKIEQFLSSGGNEAPEQILKNIGIDVTKPEFWKEGLKEIEEDITKLEKMVKDKAKKGKK